MGHDIERYLNIRAATSPSVAPDGTLAFLIDTTGVPQVWTLSRVQEWPTQLTFSDERVTFCSWSPTRLELIYGMDHGGDEREQLFLLDPSSGDIEPMTARPSAKHRWGGWSNDGDQFAFTSNHRDISVFDVYVQSRNDSEARLVYEGDGWLTAAGWSPTDDRLLVHEAFASSEHELHILDLGTNQLTQLTDTDGPTRYISPVWGSDGERIWMASDVYADTMELVAIDSTTGSIETIRDGGDWSITEVEVDQETGRLVYTSNVDGFTEVTVADIDDGTLLDRCTAQLPPGVAGGISFFPDAACFAIGTESRQLNPNIFVVDSTTGEATRWTDASTAGIPRSPFRSPELIRFESFDGLEIPALWSTPGDAELGETPAIVDIHGGPESQRRPSFSSVHQYFLANGYAILELNVRGSSGYGRSYAALDDVERRMDSVADIGAALDWLNAQPVVDTDRLVALGGSYGGFMVLASLIEYPERWAAGVDIVGIANFVSFLENTGDWRRKLREAEYGSLAADRELLEEISPINRVDAIETPLFVLHGANDPRVPVGETEQIVEALRTREIPVRKLIFDDEGHGFSKLRNRIEAYQAIVEFLEEYVR